VSVFTWVCNVSDISADNSVCVCVQWTGWLSLLTKDPGPHILTASPVSSFLGLLLAIPIISWPFAHMQHEGH